jgi:hypothetical protein
MSDLPDELLQSAFSHIPCLETINRLRQCCKRFNALLSDDYFYLLLARQQGIPPRPTTSASDIVPSNRNNFIKQYLVVYPPDMAITWMGTPAYWELVATPTNYSGTISYILIGFRPRSGAT